MMKMVGIMIVKATIDLKTVVIILQMVSTMMLKVIISLLKKKQKRKRKILSLYTMKMVDTLTKRDIIGIKTEATMTQTVYSMMQMGIK